MSKPDDSFAWAVREVFGQYVPDRKIEALRLELNRIKSTRRRAGAL
jgi:hypothetical protein